MITTSFKAYNTMTNTYKEFSTDPNYLRKVAHNQVRLGNKVIAWIAYDSTVNRFYTEWEISSNGK